MNQASRRRLPRKFVWTISPCDCFSRGNRMLALVGKPTALPTRHARPRQPVSAERADPVVSSIRVNCLQGMAKLNTINSHFGNHKVASPELTARGEYKLRVMSELPLALNGKQLTGATPRCICSIGTGLRRRNSTKFLEPRPRGVSRSLRGQGLTFTSEGRCSPLSTGRFPDHPNWKSSYPLTAANILPKRSSFCRPQCGRFPDHNQQHATSHLGAMKP